VVLRPGFKCRTRDESLHPLSREGRERGRSAPSHAAIGRCASVPPLPPFAGEGGAQAEGLGG